MGIGHFLSEGSKPTEQMGVVEQVKMKSIPCDTGNTPFTALQLYSPLQHYAFLGH